MQRENNLFYSHFVSKTAHDERRPTSAMTIDLIQQCLLPYKSGYTSFPKLVQKLKKPSYNI